MVGDKVDFFISYTKTDEEWAKWIAGQLEGKKYTIVIQAWDFKPGTNFVSNMQNALIDCERFIAVISSDYFRSLYCQAEWTAAFTRDPSCEKALFIPVRVKECKPEGLFAPIIYIDLFGVEEQEAVKRLMDGLSSDGRRIMPAFPGPSNTSKFPGQRPFNNLPFRRNPNFTGRKDIFESIRKSFERGQYASLTQLLCGLGGIGKTQIVLEYAFRYGDLYDTIWWVNAESSHTLMKAYSDFVYTKMVLDRKVNETKLVLEAVWNWMSQHKNWLFIYDNAEDYKFLYDYFPRNFTGHILITSRYTNWYRLGAIISIDEFKPEEAVEFLVKRTGIEERNSSAELAEDLGYLPLALGQAGAYIFNNKITYKRYRDLFEKYKIRIFDGYKSNEYMLTTAVTWDVSFAKVVRESSRQLLNICSFFASVNIDKKTFIDNNEFLPEPLASEVQDTRKYNKVISELTQYSLIKIHGDKISVNQLLQEVIRESINKNEWLEYCLDIMHKVFVFDNGNINNWDILLNLIPHAQSIIKQANKFSVNFEKVSRLYHKIEKLLDYNAMSEKANSLSNSFYCE